MGYRSTVTGMIRLEPGIAEHLMEEGQPFALYREDVNQLPLGVRTIDDSTVGILADGSIGVIGQDYSEVFCTIEDEFKAYEFEDDVKTLFALIKKHSPQSVGSGCLSIQGEGALDIWRIRVEGLEVHAEYPKLVWPNGDEYQLDGAF